VQNAYERISRQDPGSGDVATTKTYCCTFCNGTFESMGTWKRHEQDFHEPQRQWKCPENGCNQTFWQKSKFERHHEKEHGCTKCTHAATVVADILPRKSGWGCGFCVNGFSTWKARCTHVAAHFEAVPRAYKKDWDHRTVMKGLLLQPRLIEAHNSLSDDATAVMEGLGGKTSITPRAVDEILRDLQYSDEQQDCRHLVEEALVYLDLHSGNSTRGSSPPPPSTTYFDSNDGSYSNGLSASDNFTEFSETLMSSDNGLDFSRFCQEELFDDPNQDPGLGQYGFWASIDDNLLYAPDPYLDKP
jgi:hypothetical protein